MVDFGSLPGIRFSAAAQSVAVLATRTHCFNGSISSVEIRCSLRVLPNGQVFAIEEGGVTGYETFYIKDFMSQRTRRGEPSCEWVACVGTRERWDRLVVSDGEMRKAFAAFGIEVT